MVFHPSHRPLEIAHAIPTVPQPRRRRSSLTNKQNKGTLLSSYGRGHFYWALTRTMIFAAKSVAGWSDGERHPADPHLVSLLARADALRRGSLPAGAGEPRLAPGGLSAGRCGCPLSLLWIAVEKISPRLLTAQLRWPRYGFGLMCCRCPRSAPMSRPLCAR